MLITSQVTKLEMYDARIKSLDGCFSMGVKLTKVHKRELKQNCTLAEMMEIQWQKKTKLGWFLMSPGQEYYHNCMLLTQTSQTDYEELCRLDIIGLADSCEHDQMTVYDEFKELLI